MTAETANEQITLVQAVAHLTQAALSVTPETARAITTVLTRLNEYETAEVRTEWAVMWKENDRYPYADEETARAVHRTLKLPDDALEFCTVTRGPWTPVQPVSAMWDDEPGPTHDLRCDVMTRTVGPCRCGADDPLADLLRPEAGSLADRLEQLARTVFPRAGDAA